MTLYIYIYISILLFSSGIKLVNSNDDLGQNYNTPDHVYKRFTNDHTTSPVIMIVGRGITEAQNVTEEAKRYRLASINNTSTI
ncbi:unnamed protein product [Trichobilharzia regenti]|nr:unnamed protein product [Trichobilharzia regenti]